MTIQSGSPNVSRLEGVYAYPVWRYSNQPISAVQKIQGSSEQVALRATLPIEARSAEAKGAEFRGSQAIYTRPGSGTGVSGAIRSAAENSLTIGAKIDLLA